MFWHSGGEVVWRGEGRPIVVTDKVDGLLRGLACEDARGKLASVAQAAADWRRAGMGRPRP